MFRRKKFGKLVFTIAFGFSFSLLAQPLKKLNPGDPLPADLFIKLARNLNPVVVNISTTQLNKSAPSYLFDSPFDLFALPDQKYRAKPITSLGTGFIIRENGLILTNTHVINRADKIQVQFIGEDQKFYEAKIMGQDIYTDVAIVKINTGHKLPVATLGNSGTLQVGEWVSAFGNPYGHGHTMTKGIISAVNREIDELNLFPFLQTDAIINPGNSGGPLVNTAGEVIGINTAMRTQGISFAIPIDNVKVVLKDLEKHGRVRRGFIGVQMAQAQGKKGALVVYVMPDSPAEKSGVQIQDLIVSFNKRKIKSYKDLFKAVASTPVNQKIPMQLIRNRKIIDLNIVVAERKKISDLSQKKAPEDKKTHPQKAHFNLGMVIVTGSKNLMVSMNLPPLNRNHPIITEVKAGSPGAFAGLRKKDIILKVNGWRVQSSREAQRRLFRNRTNTLNVLRYQSYSRRYVNMIFKITPH